jgi:branched-subunit amino acid transport protein
MEIEQIYIYLFVMSAVTIAIRLVPLTLIRGQVRNQFLRSFLYYVPYVTLAVMTFPAILSATQTPISGALAFAAGIALAWYGASLFKVSAACCVIVFVVELGLC